MYTLSKGPSKIVASARRGPPRQLDFESYDSRDKSSKSFRNGDRSGDQTAEMSAPRPTFQQRRSVNNKRPPQSSGQDPTLQENHLAMAALLSRQWKKVEENRPSGREGEFEYELYREKESNRKLDNFQPFDLEKFWGSRTLKSALGKPPS